MATELMKNWIVELHNPERNQTTGSLGRLDLEGVKSNCCLGVLCEVKGIQPEEGQHYQDFGTELVYDRRSGMPNGDVIRAVLGDNPSALSDDDSSVVLYEEEDTDLDGNSYTRTITADYANDARGKTFKEIAEYLSERYLSGDEQFEVRKRIEDLGWA